MQPRWLTTVAFVAVVVLASCAPASQRAGEADEAAPVASEVDAVSAASPSEEPSVEASPSEEPSASEPSRDEEDTATGEQQTPSADRRQTDGPRLAAASQGDSGKKVERLQERLEELGYTPGAIDGSYGPGTAGAVEAFQRVVGLEPTGEVDRKTVAALQEHEDTVKVLSPGDSGRAVKRLQRELAAGPFDPGPIDGEYGGATVEAVYALEKLAGLPLDGAFGAPDQWALEQLAVGKLGGAVERHDQRWVEVDLARQLVAVYDPDDPSTPVLASHTSTGSGETFCTPAGGCRQAVTPTGTYHISRRIAGWRVSELGELYNPLYFNGGIAFHGAYSVPTHPASHGCVRLPMHIAEYMPEELPDGTPVVVMS